MEAQPEQPAEEIERLQRRIGDLSRVVGELGQRLAQRTRELAAAHEKLRREATERRGDETLHPRLLASGAVECLFKPFSEAALLQALDAALRVG